MSAFKSSASSLFSRLKDTSKAVVDSVQQSMAGRDLDFYCITSRLAAMSFPAEGLESTYRNHIEDVRGMMDNLGELARYSDTFRGHPLQRTQGTLFVREELRSKFTLKSLGPGWICPHTILESH